MTWYLKQTKQCAKCPWKKGVNPYDIPDGYDVEKHKSLESTIATPGELNLGEMKAMACHEGEKNYCIGWVHNQLGEGNNIGLRLRFRSCGNVKDIEVVGEQHSCFKDTLPKE